MLMRYLHIQLMHRDYRYISYMRTEFYNIFEPVKFNFDPS